MFQVDAVIAFWLYRAALRYCLIVSQFLTLYISIEYTRAATVHRVGKTHLVIVEYDKSDL